MVVLQVLIFIQYSDQEFSVLFLLWLPLSLKEMFSWKFLSSFYGKLLTLNHSLYLNSVCKYYFGIKSCDHLKDISICFIRSQRGRVEVDFIIIIIYFYFFFFFP